MVKAVMGAANAVLNPLGLKLGRRSGQINDGAYWDSYVKEWERSEESRALGVLGKEWKGEDVFLSLLRKHAPGSSVALEIGCGGGRITEHAAKLFPAVHACDVSREMLRKNRETIRAGNVSYHELDGFTLKGFADSSVDCVFSHDVFVHFSSLQVYPYLLEIRRVLKPGGIGLVSFYNFPRHFELFKEMSLGYAKDHIYPPHMRVHFLTHEMLALMLADIGLREVEVDTANFLVSVFQKP